MERQWRGSKIERERECFKKYRCRCRSLHFSDWNSWQTHRRMRRGAKTHVIFGQNHLIFGQAMDKIFGQLTSAPLNETGPVCLWAEHTHMDTHTHTHIIIFLVSHHNLLCIFYMTAIQNIFCAAVFFHRSVQNFKLKYLSISHHLGQNFFFLCCPFPTDRKMRKNRVGFFCFFCFFVEDIRFGRRIC